MYEFKVSRLERIKEDGVTKRLCIGINCFNTETKQSSYMDWEANVKDVGKTKLELKTYIKNYLTAITNADAPAEEQVRIVDSLKAQTLAPVVTREAETILGEDTSLTI